MRVSVSVPDFSKALKDIEGEIAKASTDAMREASNGLKTELREQIVSVGMGARLANTWRGEVYPQSGRSLSPAGYVWSKAPDIVDAFSRGVTIRPTGGAKYLWIPTKNVPRARGRVSRSGKNIRGGAMTPEEVENQFNTDFIILKGRAGTLLAFVDVIASLNKRSFRPSTRGRLAQGRKSKPVLMFVLRRTVTMPKRLELNGPAQRWAQEYTARLERKLAA